MTGEQAVARIESVLDRKWSVKVWSDRSCEPHKHVFLQAVVEQTCPGEHLDRFVEILIEDGDIREADVQMLISGCRAIETRLAATEADA